MTESLESMDSLSTEQQELAAELVAKARDEGVELTGPDGLLTGLTKRVLETALEARCPSTWDMTSTIPPAVTGAIRAMGRGPRRC